MFARFFFPKMHENAGNKVGALADELFDEGVVKFGRFLENSRIRFEDGEVAGKIVQE